MPEDEQKEAASEETPKQTISIQKIYMKDVSLETPNSPELFTQNVTPSMKVDLNVSINVLDKKGIYEVVLAVTVVAESEDKTAFLVEVNQAGIFNIVGFDKANLDGLLGSYCPNILFSYAREAVSELVSKGGFPQLILQPVNFDALYTQKLQANQAAAESESSAEKAIH